MIPPEAIKPIRKNGRDSTEVAVGTLFEYRVFPANEEGIDQAKKLIAGSDKWLVPSMLPEYYDGIHSDLMTGKENDAIRAITKQLKEFYGLSSAGKESERVIEELTPQIPQARYIQGKAGVWELEFESVIDHAIYFAGKSPIPKGHKQAEIIDWLQGTLGLSWDDISEHRDKIIDMIRQLTPDAWEKGNYPHVFIPRIDPDFEIETYIDADEEEPDDLDDLLNDIRNEDEDEDEEDVEGLDELLDTIKNNSATDAEEKETEKTIDEANEVVEDIEIDPDVLSDLPASLQESLARIINRKTGTKVNTDEKKERGSAATNTKIYRFLTDNLTKIQSQLNSIDTSIKEQNILLSANLDLNLKTLQSVENQDLLLERKLDTILDLYTNQISTTKKYEKDLKNQEAEARLEAQKNSAFTTGFTNVGGETIDPNSMLGRLIKFFGAKAGKKLWKMLPKGIRSRARLLRKTLNPRRLLGKVAQNILAKKTADKATQKATQKFVVKGFEHIALPALKSADNVAAKGVQKSGGNLLQRALGSSVIQKALVNKLGKEGAEKLSVKLAAKLLPFAGTAYGLGEGLTRIMMGDIKGGFLSFGSAIPVAGYGFAAVDILRDIDTASYTKHIEGPAMSGKLGDEQFAAFFAEALGVTENQYESGTTNAKPGVAMLHGTELIMNKNEREQINPLTVVGGSLLSATTNYINSMGPLAAAIAPTFKQIAAPIAEEYNIPKIFTQTKVGGSLPNLSQQFKDMKAKRKQTTEEQLHGIEKDLLETKNPESFADKLLKMLDPRGLFQELLKNLNRPNDPTVNGDSLMAEGGYAVESSDVGDKFGSRGGEHKGIDIRSNKFTMGTPISIIKPGIVADVGMLSEGTGDPKGWGNFVVVKHDDGLYSLYGHLSEVNATKGQRLEPSSAGVFPVIGKIGSTGHSTGAHLHLEVGTGWTGGVLTGHINPLPIVNQLMRGGGNVKKIDRPTGTPVKLEGLGQQAIMGNKNFGATSGVGNKGYLIVPGHAAGDGTPGEKELVKKLATNAYQNLKQKYPNAPIQYVDPDAMFADNKPGWEKQKKWYEQKEKEGWEILEVHMDASMESGEGSGRGVIAPHHELNPIEKIFAENFGAYDRRHRSPTDNRTHADESQRPLAGPSRGIGLFELGNMSPELQQATEKNNVSKKQLDSITAPLEQAIQSGLNLQQISPPNTNQRQRFESMSVPKNTKEKFLIINQEGKPSANMSRNSSVEFVPLSPGRWISVKGYSDTIRKLIMAKLSQ